jgi:hypothetical protein
MPMKRLNYLRVVGRTIFLMASTFLGIGCIPDRLIHYPRYSISVAPKVGFSAFTRKTLSDGFFRTHSNFSKSSSKVLHEMTRRSSSYVLIKLRCCIKSDIFLEKYLVSRKRLLEVLIIDTYQKE